MLALAFSGVERSVVDEPVAAVVPGEAAVAGSADVAALEVAGVWAGWEGLAHAATATAGRDKTRGIRDTTDRMRKAGVLMGMKVHIPRTLTPFVLALAIAGAACDRANTAPAPALTAPSSAAPAPGTLHFDGDPDSAFRMTLDYPSAFVLRKKPDGVHLESEPLADVEDLSDGACARTRPGCRPGGPTPMDVDVSMRPADVMSTFKAESPGIFQMAFPSGKEASFTANEAVSQQVVSGRAGYRAFLTSADTPTDETFAPVGDDRWSVVVECHYVAKAAPPRMTFQEQVAACDRVVSSLRVAGRP